jgi:hypothetical protein
MRFALHFPLSVALARAGVTHSYWASIGSVTRLDERTYRIRVGNRDTGLLTRLQWVALSTGMAASPVALLP